MSFTSVGDQSQYFLIRNQNARLKADSARLAQEMATGQLVKPATPQAGDAAQLMALGRSLQTLESYTSTNGEAGVFADVAQTALGTVSDLLNKQSATLLTAGTSENPTMLGNLAADAKTQFATAVQALNVQAAGRSVFGGSVTDKAPLADADTILASLGTAISGLSSVDDIASAVDAWFDTPGGGFDTVAYQGGGNAPSFRVADDVSVTTGVTAQNQGVKDALKTLAMGALIGDPAVAASLPLQAQLATLAGTRMTQAASDLPEVQADIGSVQAQIETRTAGQSAEKTALQLAQSKFADADPYDTATAYQQVTTQLQSLYAMTARLSQLSLVNFLS
jgi:flagellar hook-associated protein 3 FlgL